jgi:hypothetical protein
VASDRVNGGDQRVTQHHSVGLNIVEYVVSYPGKILETEACVSAGDEPITSRTGSIDRA